MNEHTSYFEAASHWADERDAAGARSRRLAWTIATLACAVCALEAVALALAMPLKTVTPIAVLVDRNTGFVERIDLDHPATLTADEAMRRSLLAQYVVARESFDPVGIREAYRKVALWSAGPARTSYLTAIDAGGPATRLAAGRREIALSTSVKSISMIAPGTALVRFDVAPVDADGKAGAARSYVATIAFAFVGTPMRVEDRLVNPLGFQVRSYRVDPEIAPDAPGRAS